MKKIRNLIVYLGLGIVIIFVYPMPHKIFSGQDLNKISTPDFRQAEWGMNKEQVKKLEKSELIGELDKALLYKGILDSLNTLFRYDFISNKLISGSYIFTEKHTNNNDYISDYSKLKLLLTKKYGNPKIDGEHWKNNLFKDQGEQYKGNAVSAGHLAYIASWETKRTIIKLVLGGENFKINFGLIYESKESEGLMEKTREKEALDNL